MRAYIQLISSDQTDQIVELCADQSLVVGRLPECGLSLPADPAVSRRHCRIDLTASGCRVVNLSSNGTRVNGRPIEELRLRNGDEIQLGAGTVLQVFLEETEDAYKTQRPLGATAPVQPSGATRLQAPATYRTEPCRSGLTRFLSTATEPPLVDVVQALSSLRPLLLIVDFGRLPTLTKPAEPAYLFDFLPEETRSQFSPVILRDPEDHELATILDQGWGRDAVVALFLGEDPELVVPQLRRAAGAWGRPSVIGPQLSESLGPFVQTLMTGVAAVLLESDSPGRWTFLAPAEWESVLHEAGFAPSAAASTTAARSKVPPSSSGET